MSHATELRALARSFELEGLPRTPTTLRRAADRIERLELAVKAARQRVTKSGLAVIDAIIAPQPQEAQNEG
jgi:hypothetical protein